MKVLKENHTAISTILAFALLPLSGFATDIYLPSFPAMAELFGSSQGDIQLSLVVFVVSYGISQLFVGSFLDSFGRYRLSLAALLTFAISSFIIATTHSLAALLSMRVIQGMSVALIIVGKRAFFIDVYAGSKLKHYASLFSIIWAAAPIIAPFLGGFLQHYFGWESNFYFLGLVTIVILILELVYSGETLKASQPFKLRPLLNVYSTKLGTPDFTLSLLILGASFSMVIVFNMASPFIIGHVFHQSAVAIGNSALLSGIAVMAGGLLSKSVIDRPLQAKISAAGILLIMLSSLMVVFLYYSPTLISLMTMVVLLHIVSGFTFNTFFTYALGRFKSNAGIVSGITGGGTYIITSALSYTVVSLLQVQDVLMLAFAYLTFAGVIGSSLILFVLIQKRNIARQLQAAPAV